MERLRDWVVLKLKRAFGLHLAEDAIHRSLHLSARILVNDVAQRAITNSLSDCEFRVYSQWGDDGIIQYLIHHIDLPNEQRSFVEFGVEDYSEATTRFLLTNDNWRGLVLDSDPANIRHIQRDSISWRHDLTSASAFVTPDNVDSIFAQHGFQGDIGLLHIDIDGNDYWVWKAITSVRPAIAIVEYNAVFGNQHAITIPYDPKFSRSKAHYSNLYFGASLPALVALAKTKGYAFVGCNSAGNNAYFLRSNLLGELRPKTVSEGFVPSRFRESRDRHGALSLLSGDARLLQIADCRVLDTTTGLTVSIGALFKIHG